jgi:MFS family permease
MKYLLHTSWFKEPTINIVLLILGIILIRIGWFSTMPFMTIYLTKVLKIHSALVGVIVGIGYLTSCLAGFWVGVISDKLGPKKLLVTSLILSSLLFFFFTFSRSALAFAFINSFVGIAIAAYETASKSYIVKVAPLNQRATIFSFRYAAINLGASIGPLLGVYLISHNPNIIFDFTAFIFLMSGIFLNYFLKDILHDDSRKYKYPNFAEITRTVFSDKALLSLVVIGCILYIGYSQLETTIPLALSQIFPDYLSFYSKLIILNALIIIIFQVPMNFILRKFNLLKVSYIAVFLISFSFFLLASFNTKSWFIIAILVLTFSEIINATLSNVLADRIAPAELKGLYFGIINISTLGFFIGPAFGGLILKYLGYKILYLIIGVLVLICVWLYKFSSKRTNYINL